MGKKKSLPQHLQVQHDHVLVGPEQNSHTSTQTSASVYSALGVDNSWSFDEFAETFQIKINSLRGDTMEFDMIGADPSIANSLRRILIADVPTMAIEHVFMVNNTSIIQDEVFSHRLGLVPLFVDPTPFEIKTSEEAPSEKNTLVFKLDVTCSRQGDRVINSKVTSDQLIWLPKGSEMPEETSSRFAAGQAHMYTEENKPRPVHADILLAKLRPGQSIQLEAHCIRGTGHEHAKWSPVATAWFRLHPEIILKKEVTGDIADELCAAAPGLFVKDSSGKLEQPVARGNEHHLEKVRRLLDQDRYSSVLQYRKRKNHFIFTIESSGCLPPDELLSRALVILSEKATKLAERL
ncbi:MAG: hypothetical protein WDW38_001777 [Sanguina aurantia]